MSEPPGFSTDGFPQLSRPQNHVHQRVRVERIGERAAFHQFAPLVGDELEAGNEGHLAAVHQGDAVSRSRQCDRGHAIFSWDAAVGIERAQPIVDAFGSACPPPCPLRRPTAVRQRTPVPRCSRLSGPRQKASFGWQADALQAAPRWGRAGRWSGIAAGMPSDRLPFFKSATSTSPRLKETNVVPRDLRSQQVDLRSGLAQAKVRQERSDERVDGSCLDSRGLGAGRRRSTPTLLCPPHCRGCLTSGLTCR